MQLLRTLCPKLIILKPKRRRAIPNVPVLSQEPIENGTFADILMRNPGVLVTPRLLRKNKSRSYQEKGSEGRRYAEFYESKEALTSEAISNSFTKI